MSQPTDTVIAEKSEGTWYKLNVFRDRNNIYTKNKIKHALKIVVY